MAPYRDYRRSVSMEPKICGKAAAESPETSNFDLFGGEIRDRQLTRNMRPIETSVAMNDNDLWLIEIRSSQMVSLNVSPVSLVLSDFLS